MQIEYLGIDELKPYENNPRRNEEAVDRVASSISAYGFKNPIIIDKDNVIVCGDTRYKAAKKLELKQVPVIRADDLTPEQIRAYRLADNKVSEFSTWDFELLNIELEELDGIFDMSEFGFFEADENYIDDLFDEPEEKAEEEEKTDDEDDNSGMFVVVSFDDEESFNEFVDYCEQNGYDYERGERP